MWTFFLNAGPLNYSLDMKFKFGVLCYVFFKLQYKSYEQKGYEKK